MKNYQSLFEKLWKHYVQLNPQAEKIHSLLESQGNAVLNDHVAFRTFDNCSFDVSAHVEFFKDYGYLQKGEYKFEEKKLFAVHLEHQSDESAPKIFVSELLRREFSDSLNDQMSIIEKNLEPKNFEEIFDAGRTWSANHSTYKTLYLESEYAAWFYLFGLCANHFTVNINALESFTEVSELNIWLQNKGFELNESGGKVKGSKEVLLEQSSTMSATITQKLDDGEFDVPGCYYEFAKRYAMPNGKLYQGFVAASADKIFESTKEKS